MTYSQIMQAQQAELKRRLKEIEGSISPDQQAEATLIRKELAHRVGCCVQ